MGYVDAKRWGHFRNKRWPAGTRRGSDGSTEDLVGFTLSILLHPRNSMMRMKIALLLIACLT